VLCFNVSSGARVHYLPIAAPTAKGDEVLLLLHVFRSASHPSSDADQFKMVLRFTSISISYPDPDVDEIDRPLSDCTSGLDWSLGEPLVSPAFWVELVDAKGRGWMGWEPLRYGKCFQVLRPLRSPMS